MKLDNSKNLMYNLITKRKGEKSMLTKDQITDELFMFFDYWADLGMLHDDEIQRIEELRNEYYLQCVDEK